MYLQGRDEYSMDNHLSPTVLGTSCRPGGLQKKKGCVGNDQSLSLGFQEYTEWKRNRRCGHKIAFKQKGRGPGTHLRAQLKEKYLSSQD